MIEHVHYLELDDDQIVVKVDESASDLGKLFSCLGTDSHNAQRLPNDFDSAELILRLAEKYEVRSLIVTARVHFVKLLESEPFKLIQYASRTNDIELAKRTIRNMGSSTYDGIDIWKAMADWPPAWQIEYARLVTPKLTYDDQDWHVEGKSTALCMDDVAKRFNPK